MTFAELGKKYGYTRERIRQIEANAFAKLQRTCRSNPKMIAFLESYFDEGLDDIFNRADSQKKLKKIKQFSQKGD